MCGSVRLGGGEPRNVWQNGVVKAAVERKEVGWKKVLGARGKVVNKDVWKLKMKKRERLKGVLYLNK